MNTYYADERTTVYHGDCLDVLASMPDSSVDSIVTDPPYGLSNTKPAQVADVLAAWVTGDTEAVPAKRGGFMGKDWDSFVPPPAVWDECLRVLKPGGHVVAFAGSRTHDLMTLSIRLAGFEIRDSLAWLYGSGFPKSMDVSKAIDKAAGAEREVVGPYVRRGDRKPYVVNSSAHVEFNNASTKGNVTAPATPEAKQWDGWGTALKPAFEPIVLARKPFPGTVAENVLEHGTGAINIDACRIGTGGQLSWSQPRGIGYMGGGTDAGPVAATESTRGRWPANVLLDEHAATWVDEQSGVLRSGARKAGQPRNASGKSSYVLPELTTWTGEASAGGASRFFPVFKYQAKAPKSERPVIEREDGTKIQHPTVKPLALMRWLLRLVTPPGGTTLDPFAGSGTTIEAAMMEGFHPVGIEKETDYLPLITARIARAKTTAQETLDLGGTA